MKDNIIIGSHVKMSGPEYYLGSVKQAVLDNANTLMLYTGAPQNTTRTPLEQLKIGDAILLTKTHNLFIKHFVCHAPYLINLAHIDGHELGIKLLSSEMNRCGAMGINTIVVHPGSHKDTDQETAISCMVNAINEVLRQVKNEVIIALETMPGAGTQVGSLEELNKVLKLVDQPDRVGICLDTCHLFSYGVDVRNTKEFIEIIDNTVGIQKVKCIHLNDSMNEFASRKDRHANIGCGQIGFKALYDLVHSIQLEGIPFILETPYINDKSPYKYEIEMLRSGSFIPNWNLDF